MRKFAEMAFLVDFYGPLLTEKQRNVWDFHYQQDLSLTEIAEIAGISRQAIHDLLKRTEKILVGYEEKLGLVQRFLAERERLLAIESSFAKLINQEDFDGQVKIKLKNILKQIQEVIVKVSEE
ncbi:MAG: putative DNA-binding protein [Desulfitobacteriaceae bacterium]|nr:putative DNA-binding protein [Desulfitobacteriaceae bacterium]MDD4345953.1 putative DNA-binding protein [Desulfitobacteriaceae bacterium]MDD4401389.1 putative DNA-binding protein [Desulfitobacteriaceae bacterium]